MDMRNLKLINHCWNCGAAHEVSEVKYDQQAADKSVKCHCGGYIVTPSGKVQLQVVPAVPVWLIEDGSETFRVAAGDDKQALQFMIDEWGMEDVDDVEVTAITDQEELQRKFILSEEGLPNLSIDHGRSESSGEVSNTNQHINMVRSPGLFPREGYTDEVHGVGRVFSLAVDHQEGCQQENSGKAACGMPDR